LVSLNKFLGFFIGFMVMGNGLASEGEKGKVLIVAGAIIAATFFLLPRLIRKWKTINMLRMKHGIKTHKEFLDELKTL